jgi:hypothetical protein
VGSEAASVSECEVCFREVEYLLTARFMGDLECNECREYREYYNSLTPQQLREEHEAMARYVEETEADQWG